MPINDRNLPAGTVLAGRYKGQTYRCTVLEHEGALAFALEDNSIHKSPSAAASKIMNGASVNGWRFWSLEGELPEAASKADKPATTKGVATKLVRQIKKLPNQKGVPEGMTKFHCSACMESFLSETAEPETCPAGHPRETADEFAATPKDAASAD